MAGTDSNSTATVFSSADSFAGSLEADGFLTTIGPFGQVSGAAPPAYDLTKHIGAFDGQYDLTGAELNSLSLHMQADQMLNTAEGVGDLGAGAADLASASFALIDSPLPTLSVVGLSVDATGIDSDSESFDGSLSGDASFTSLTVTGALLHGKTLRFSGNAAPDTVLYSSPTVTITLDAQILLLPPASLGGVFGPSIATDAIDIKLNDAKLFGHTISGDFAIGQSSAGYPLIPPGLVTA